MKTRNNHSTEDLLGIKKPAFRRVQVHLPPDEIFYIDSEIVEPSEYYEMINAIQYASKGTQIFIHINSPGGCLDTCLSIVNAIVNSDARETITTCIDGQACSAAALIWCAADNKTIGSEHVYLMFHQPSYTMSGNVSSHGVELDMIKKLSDKLTKDLTVGILTEKELSDYDKGINIYLTGKEIIDRLEKDNNVDVDTIEESKQNDN